MAGPDDDAALEARLRTESSGPPTPPDNTPWDFVYRLPEPEIRERAWPIISRLLVDDDETIRARTVEFQRIWTAGRAVTTPRILEVAEQHAALYGGQVVEGMTLRYQLGFALANLAFTVGERVAKLILAMNHREAIAGSVVGRYYPEYTIARAPQYGDAGVDWIADAAGALALYRRDSIAPLLDAIRELSQDTRQRTLDAVEGRIRRDDAAAAAIAKSEGFPPPRKPAPTREDRRHAAGL